MFTCKVRNLVHIPFNVPNIHHTLQTQSTERAVTEAAAAVVGQEAMRWLKKSKSNEPEEDDSCISFKEPNFKYFC